MVGLTKHGHQGHYRFHNDGEKGKLFYFSSHVKAVSLPQWLAVMAEEAGISFSQVLALKRELGLE
jgi:hypothetical protein